MRSAAALPPPRLALAAGLCAVRVPLCIEEHWHWAHASRLPDGQLPTINRYMGRLGITGLARALGTSVAVVDRWVCSGVRPDKAADISARLLLLVVHELVAAGRCGCRACVPSKDEQRLDQLHRTGWGRERDGAPSAGRVRFGALAWCRGTRRHLEVCA